MKLYDIDEKPYNIVTCQFNGKTAIYDHSKFNQFSFPFWVSFPPFYMSHQAALCRKDPKFYKNLIREELYPFIENGYLWPSNVNSNCYLDWNFSYHEPLSCGCPPIYRINTVEILRWLMNPNINPNTNRQISNTSQIYLDYKNAMENYGIKTYFDINFNCECISLRGNYICRLNDIMNGIVYLENFYKNNGGYPTATQLCIFFSNN